MSEKDIVVETRELLSRYPEGKVFAPNSRDLDQTPELLRALADEVERLRDLVVHMQVHSGYLRNGYMQMTTEQKALYDQTWERSVAELDAEESQQ